MRLEAKGRMNHQRADKADSFLNWDKINTKSLRLGYINIKQENLEETLSSLEEGRTQENIQLRQRLLLAEVAARVFKSWGNVRTSY